MVAIVIVIVFGFVFLIAYGCARQSRIHRGQRQIAQLAELLLIRHALEISTSAASKPADSAENQQPQA